METFINNMQIDSEGQIIKRKEIVPYEPQDMPITTFTLPVKHNLKTGISSVWNGKMWYKLYLTEQQ